MKKIIRFCLYHPIWVLAVVALITAFFAFQVPNLKMDPRVEVILKQNNPVEKVYNANNQEFEPYADIIVGMLHDDIYTPSSLEKIRNIAHDIEEIQGIKRVTYILNMKNIQGSESGLDVSPMYEDGEVPGTDAEVAALRERVDSWTVNDKVYVAGDGKGTALLAVLEDDVETDAIIPIYYSIDEILKTYDGPEQYFVSGTKVIEALQGHYMIKDLIFLPPLVCIVLLGSLYLFFRNLRGTILPLVSVAISAIWTVGLMAIFRIPLTIVTTALPVALMACGSAYGIHVVENVLSDIAEGRRGLPGINRALNRIRMPIIMASLTTMAAFISLCSTPIVPLVHFGLFTAYGIIVSMVLALTFIPAVLSLLETHGREFVPHHHSSKDIVSPLLKKLAYISIHKNWWVIGVSLVVLVISVILGSHVKSDLNLIEDFREGSPIRVADKILNENFGGTSQFNVVFETGNPDDIKEPAVLREMERLQAELNTHPDIGKAVSIVDFIKRMNQAMHDGDPAFYTIPESRELIAQYLLLFSFSGGGEELESFVNYDYDKGQILLQMKSGSGYLAQDVVDAVDRFRENDLQASQVTNIFTTGLAMLAKEFNRLVVKSQVQSFVFSFLLCFIITAGIFRSLRLGLYCMVPLIIPIALDFAIMGVGGIRLNAATATVASIDIGIGIDYSIHFLNRYRHGIWKGYSVPQALETALTTSGRGIIYNALAVGAGFLVLLPSQFVILSQAGLLVAIDMITISFSVLTFLPACIILLPPKFLKKIPERTIVEVPFRLRKQKIAAQGAGVVEGDSDNTQEKIYREVQQ
ncbi:MAG: efflux RND transporter permease subunit [Desulfomonilia bacterium]